MLVDITPKRSVEPWRGDLVHTCPWRRVIEFYRDLNAQGCRMEPMVQLVETLAASPASEGLFPGTSMWRLLLSDTPEFHLYDSTLYINYRSDAREFDFEHFSLKHHGDHRTCPESEALETLQLFLRYKFGVMFDLPAS